MTRREAEAEADRERDLADRRRRAVQLARMDRGVLVRARDAERRDVLELPPAATPPRSAAAIEKARRARPARTKAERKKLAGTNMQRRRAIAPSLGLCVRGCGRPARDGKRTCKPCCDAVVACRRRRRARLAAVDSGYVVLVHTTA